ncbi:MAG: hypothetical protein ACXWLM_00320 [Myxococcales bacterium]
MRAAVLVLLASAAAHADWRVGIGGAWSIPLQSSPNDWRSGSARQDVAGSLLLELEPVNRSEIRVHELRWLFQLEGFLGGLTASQPAFAGAAARVGVAGPLPGSAARAHLSVGAAYVRMSGPSRFECPEFGCDSLDGAGIAFSGEAAVVLPWSERAAASAFVHALLPQFQVSESLYPGNTPARVPLILLGLRLLL